MRPLYKEHDYEVYFNPIIKTFGEVYDCFGSDTEQIINSLQRKYKAASRLFEKLTTAVMLKEIFGKETTLSYTPEGRPFMKPGLSISISHSKSHVAILLSKQPHVGIDIEAISSRILNLESKIKRSAPYPLTTTTSTISRKQTFSPPCGRQKRLYIKVYTFRQI